ncbi:hypothetical protein [Pseudomonas sp. Irchel 3E19]|uniref:hypothetical protein n=1 Tax=Pseudomonas sp. Irchel 3E19 TaxID=2008981 RepID=UPI000BA37F4E|nr:hypothetical protein [Pseudomonas sp. Irchel 3E19]
MTIQNKTGAGQLDPTFGIEGVKRISVPGYPNFSIDCVGIGPDQQIYVAGISDIHERPTLILGRFHLDGTLDTRFGNDGFAKGAYGDFSLLRVNAITFGPADKILVFCTVAGSAAQDAAAFSRFDTKGLPDRTFAGQGNAVFDIVLSPPAATSPTATTQASSASASASASARSGMQVLSDGKILAHINYFFNWGTLQGLIMRLNEDGTLDLSLNQIGYFMVFHPDDQFTGTVLRNLLVQEDGKYLCCGNLITEMSVPSPAMFARYNTNGDRDPSFGVDGIASVADDTNANLIDIIVNLPNQKILGVGFTGDDAGVMISLKSDGSENKDFNGGKPLYTRLEPNAITVWRGVAIQKDGKIIVTGAVGPLNGQTDIVVARFTNAILDPDFNNGQGWTRTHVESGTEYAVGNTLQDDGKIVVCARLSQSKSALLRYNT